MRLNQVRDFIAVVESGSIRAAARKLGVSQPAVTKSGAIQCDSFHTAMGLIMKANMLGFVSRRMLAAPFARDVLDEIAVAESLPSYTAGMFTRADTPLTLVAAALAKAVTAVARKLGRSA